MSFSNKETTISSQPVTADLAQRITAMTDALKREFGCDFAFTIMGRGHVIAASNYKDGTVTPKVQP